MRRVATVLGSLAAAGSLVIAAPGSAFAVTGTFTVDDGQPDGSGSCELSTRFPLSAPEAGAHGYAFLFEGPGCAPGAQAMAQRTPMFSPPGSLLGAVSATGNAALTTVGSAALAAAGTLGALAFLGARSPYAAASPYSPSNRSFATANQNGCYLATQFPMYASAQSVHGYAYIFQGQACAGSMEAIVPQAGAQGYARPVSSLMGGLAAVGSAAMATAGAATYTSFSAAGLALAGAMALARAGVITVAAAGSAALAAAGGTAIALAGGYIPGPTRNSALSMLQASQAGGGMSGSGAPGEEGAESATSGGSQAAPEYTATGTLVVNAKDYVKPSGCYPSAKFPLTVTNKTSDGYAFVFEGPDCKGNLEAIVSPGQSTTTKFGNSVYID